MSWHYLQGLEEVSSEAICWDGEQFAPLNGQTTLGGYCLPDSETESYHDSQSGTMCKPLTVNLGEGESMSSVADSLAKTFPVLAKALESMAKDQGCGPKWRGSLVKLSQDGSWWKTHPYSLLADSIPFCGTWPKWGTMRNGECLERLTPERSISARDSGLWPTMVCTQIQEDYERCLQRRKAAKSPKNWGKIRANNLVMKVLMEENGGRVIQGKVLNPRWIEWFMAFPIGWTSLNPLETHKFQSWRQWRF